MNGLSVTIQIRTPQKTEILYEECTFTGEPLPERVHEMSARLVGDACERMADDLKESDGKSKLHEVVLEAEEGNVVKLMMYAPTDEVKKIMRLFRGEKFEMKSAEVLKNVKVIN